MGASGCAGGLGWRQRPGSLDNSGSYAFRSYHPGLFHGLVSDDSRGRPVLLAGTGGSERRRLCRRRICSLWYEYREPETVVWNSGVDRDRDGAYYATSGPECFHHQYIGKGHSHDRNISWRCSVPWDRDDPHRAAADGTSAGTVSATAAVGIIVVDSRMYTALPAAKHAILSDGTGQLISIEHPIGEISVMMDVSMCGGTIEIQKAAILRTAHKLFEGDVFY